MDNPETLLSIEGALATFVALLLAYIARAIAARLGIDIDEKRAKRIQQAIDEVSKTVASRAVERGGRFLQHENSDLAEAAGRVARRVPDFLRRVGVDETELQGMISERVEGLLLDYKKSMKRVDLAELSPPPGR